MPFALLMSQYLKRLEEEDRKNNTKLAAVKAKKVLTVLFWIGVADIFLLLLLQF